VVLKLKVLLYFPEYRKVLPSLIERPLKSRRSAKILWYLLGKSFPTTAISPGFTKKLAEILAKVAAPPSTSFNNLVGVLMVSSAVEPKTVSIIIVACYFV
jgi:hypothetical protein